MPAPRRRRRTPFLKDLQTQYVLGQLAAPGTGGGGGGGAGGGASGVQLEAVFAALAAADAPEEVLDDFIDAIPYANDGDVITPDHHNTLRDAIAQLADAIGEHEYARVVTSSFLPILHSVYTAPRWVQSTGFVTAPQAEGDNYVEGWMELDLPDGSDVDALIVRGKRPVPISHYWSVALRRIPLAGGDTSDVCNGQIEEVPTAADKTFSATILPATLASTPAEAAELRRIDLSRYRYVFTTTHLTFEQAETLELRLIQVVCSRP